MAPSTNHPKVWLITGCSSGFGRHFAIAARQHGDFVVATARNIEILGGLKEIGCEALTLDVTSDDVTINEAVAKAHAFHGRIDILINNAGYPTMGVTEEASADDIQANFDTNVFGLLRVTRAVLPYMREQRSGTIANMGSSVGHTPYPMFGIYGATKFAVAGLTLSLRQEVAGLGIKVTVIEPASFETAGSRNIKVFANQIAGYEPVKKVIMDTMSGGLVTADVAKGAQAIVEALTQTGRCEGRELPSRLPIGPGTYEMFQGTLDTAKKELDAWVDFTKAEAFAKDA